MEIDRLFNKNSDKKSETKDVSEKGICVTDSLENKPLIYGLLNQKLKHNFSIKSTKPNDTARILLEGETELGLIPSIEYANKKESLRIIPDICISSIGRVNNVQLFFKKGLKEIETIAVDTCAVTEKILLQILMQEKFTTSPAYIQMEPNLKLMLSKADAALITGDQALEYCQNKKNCIDLNEEWVDLTGLPMVYSFWAGREFTINKDDISIIKNSYELGRQNIDQIAKDFSKEHGGEWPFYHDFLTKNINYSFSNKAQEGLKEFYNYAFFYGYAEYIPDLYFYE